jgi:protein-disulfide isomerase
MNKIAWIIFGAATVLLITGLIVWSRITNPGVNVSAVDTNGIIAASSENGNIGDHVFGVTDSKAVLIEYGDFQCPSCGKAHPQVKAVTEEYKDKMTFIFRNFPLTSIHPNAKAAAAAVEAAGLQGKYWEMHNLVFESQSDWNALTGTERTDAFANYAVSLGLDKTKFVSDMAGSAINSKIVFDQAIGKKLNVNATPTFYFNGTKLDEATSGAIVNGSTTELKALIDKAL